MNRRRRRSEQDRERETGAWGRALVDVIGELVVGLEPQIVLWNPRETDVYEIHGTLVLGIEAFDAYDSVESSRGLDDALYVESRHGTVEARSNRPEDQPAINPRYLDDERDRRAVIGGLRFLRRLFDAPALARYVVAETAPGVAIQTDDELLEYARQTGTTVFHAACSCRMGPDTMSVVDDNLRVHGLEGLRVIDASVMPAVTSTNTNAPTIMIAEKGAAMVRAAVRARAVAA